MPIFKGMTNMSIWKAFFIKAIASSLIIIIAVTVKEKFDTFKDKKDEEIILTTNIKSIVFTFVATFVATIISYTIVWGFFGHEY
jgi:ABC-type spermidine/putrescine transport system permease subunit I